MAIMQFDFKTEMAKRTDEELIQVLTIDKESYLPEALIAAEEEFKKRNLESEKVGSIAKELSQKRKQENRKANEPLDLPAKIVAFLIPLVFTLILSGYYKTEGYHRKARELATFTLYGFCFYAVVIIIMIII